MRLALVLSVVLVASTSPAAAADKPKNIIVMIADGAGHNTLAATRFWKGAPLTVDIGPWKRASMATYALRSDPAQPVGGDPHAQDPELVYDSAKAWNTRPAAGLSKYSDKYPALFAGYEWHRKTHPDSANTMSAMMTGVRSYNGAINVDGAGKPVRSVAEAAKAAGKMTGSISSVPFNHATPAAGGGAHSADRDDYHAIAREMFTGTLDVIGGGGNPDFDHDGRTIADEAAKDGFKWLPSDLWIELKSPASNWTLVQSQPDIAALARGETRSQKPLAIIAETKETLQARRSYPSGVARGSTAPGDVPLTAGMTNLVDMTHASLNHISGDADGFFLQIEGGAVDWMMHANDFGRMIEEYDAFNTAVAAVVAWIESPDSSATWDDTLLIVTADHDHLLYGPDTSVPFDRVANNGAGKLPGYSWAFNSHSNQLVPFFARGLGADDLIAEADQQDVHTDSKGRKFGYGRYLTQTELGAYLLNAQAK